MNFFNNPAIQNEQYQAERRQQIGEAGRFTVWVYGIPLILIYIIFDHYYHPELFYEFLVIRLSVVAVVIVLDLIAKYQNYRWAEQTIFLMMICTALPFVGMVYLIGSPSSNYYAAIDLVVIAASTNVRLNWTSSLFLSLLIASAYTAVCLSMVPTQGYGDFPINLGFILATILICQTGKYYLEKLHQKNFTLRQQLEGEISNRQSIIEKTSQQLLQVQTDLLKRENELAGAKLAAQVAHDIRSPLGALELVTKSIQGLQEPERVVVHSAIRRIRSIANELLNQERAVIAKQKSELGEALPEAPTWVWHAIDEAILQKRITTDKKGGGDIHAVYDSENLNQIGSVFCRIPAVDLNRVLSNLLNNAAESGTRRIEVSMTIDSAQFVSVSIRDYGKGIPAELLEKIGQRGLTHGKEGGTGLGVFHAKETLGKFGGDLKIESTIGVGTCVTLLLPRSPTPTWFTSTVDSSSRLQFVIVDDEPFIHDVWNKNQHCFPGIGFYHLHSARELRQFYSENIERIDEFQFLIDHDFRAENTTGTELIRDLGILNQSILVTHRFDDPDLQQTCSRMGLKLMPKPWVGMVKSARK